VAGTFHCSVVTPEGAALDVEARSAVFPAYDGEIGILPSHAPLLCEVGVGALKVVTADGETRRLYIEGGFAQVVDNRLTLLTEQSSPISELQPDEAESLAEQYRGQTVSAELEREADRAFERARVQKRLVRRFG